MSRAAPSENTEARGYLWGLATVSVSIAFSGLVSRYLQLSDLVMINLLGVILISMRFGIGPSLFTAAITALSFDFFFIPPVFAFAPSDLKSTVTLCVMIVVAGVISGLGERARRQRAAARARDLQMATERLRSSLLSAVSHDLRTPLAAILGAGTELLQDGARLDVETRNGLAETIVEETERLEQIVNNLLDVTRLESGGVDVRKRPEPLDEIIEAALGRLHGRLQNRVVHTLVPEEVPMVPVDPVLVEQVFVNLLENAIRYTPEGSPIDIGARREGSGVTVELLDRGPGIRSDEPDLLFERFQRGDSPTPGDGGIGLGLTICRAIVQAHGGTISIGNRDGGGAVVRFTLPLLEPPEGATS